MKKICALLLTLTMLTTIIPTAFAQNDSTVTAQQAQNTAIVFATTSMSDFTTQSEYRDDLINSNARSLMQYLDDKREVKEIKENLFGRKLDLVAYDVENICVTDKDFAYEVYFDISFNYKDGTESSALVAAYKVIVDKNTNTILAAITNDLSGGTLINTTIGQTAEDLDLDYQLSILSNRNNMSTEGEPYDLEEKVSKLTAYWESVEHEVAEAQDHQNQELVDTPEQLDLNLPTSPYTTWVSFTESDRDAMRSYQDDWWNGFNPSFANFTGEGGDCTNYASQVLNSSSAPQYSSSASGIQGYTYWYYRSANARSTSWTGVNELRSYLLRSSTTKGPKGNRVTTFGELQSGDIVQLYNGSDFYHTIVVHTQGGDPLVTAHTSSYSGLYSTRYGGIDYSRIHIDGYYR